MSCGCDAAQILDLAQLALLIHFLEEQEFAGVDDRFGHHVFQPGLPDQFDDLPAFFNARGHGHGAHHVLARLQRGDRHRGMIGDGRLMCTKSTWGSASTSS